MPVFILWVRAMSVINQIITNQFEVQLRSKRLMFFQVEEDNKHSMRQNPATYTQILTSAARGLYR